MKRIKHMNVHIRVFFINIQSEGYRFIMAANLDIIFKIDMRISAIFSLKY